MHRTFPLGASALILAAGLLTGCSESSDALIWYVNPDTNATADTGQPGIAKRCSQELGFEIKTQALPTSATEQRIQLARRLGAEDPEIDLMSLDTPYTGEFANAGWLEPLASDVVSQAKSQALQGALDGASWEGQLYAVPFNANVQVLWYRKGFAEQAGLDMKQPVTWDQIIDAAGEAGKQVGVQANKYEGYAIWINALILGAGGDIVSDADEGVDASIDLDSAAGEDAARIIAKLADGKAAMSDLSVSNEGTVEPGLASGSAPFIVNWTYIYSSYSEALGDDLGWARYPETVAGEPSRPPIGGINIGVSAFSEHKDEAMQALNCITSVENQVQYATETGLMPSAAAAYSDPKLTDQFPGDLLRLFRESLDAAGPRPVTPYWSDVAGGILASWHPPTSVDQDTPAESAKTVEDVLHGRRLL